MGIVSAFAVPPGSVLGKFILVFLDIEIGGCMGFHGYKCIWQTKQLWLMFMPLMLMLAICCTSYAQSSWYESREWAGKKAHGGK